MSTITCKIPEVLEQQLSKLGRLDKDWDGYGADAPSRDAIAAARNLIVLMLERGIEPTYLAPSGEGGVVICFDRNNRFAGLERSNLGELMLVMSGTNIEPDVQEVEDIDVTISTIGRFIDSGSMSLCAAGPR